MKEFFEGLVNLVKTGIIGGVIIICVILIMLGMITGIAIS